MLGVSCKYTLLVLFSAIFCSHVLYSLKQYLQSGQEQDPEELVSFTDNFNPVASAGLGCSFLFKGIKALSGYKGHTAGASFTSQF